MDSCSRAIAVILGSVFFTSCSKNEVYEPNNVSEVRPELRRGITSESNLRWLIIDGVGGYECDGTGGNCFADVIVTPSSFFLEIFDAVDTHNSRIIARVFRYRSQFLSAYIDAETINGVIRQQLKVTHRYNRTQNKHYLVFKKGREVHSAYPIIVR